MRISKQIFPRPVALVTSVSKEGEPNVMTVSFIMPVSFDPKYIAIAVSPKRHTFKNLREIPEICVCMLSSDMKEQAVICGTRSGAECNKFELARLTPMEAEKVRAPIIKECPLCFECKIESMLEFGDHYLVVARVVKEHVKREFTPLMHVSGSEFRVPGSKV